MKRARLSVQRPEWFNPARMRTIGAVTKPPPRPQAVVLWMSRDQRVEDNWALLFARSQAVLWEVPLHVVFNLIPEFPNATLRAYDFMFKGLAEVSSSLASLGIGFRLLRGDAAETVPSFVKTVKAGLLVTDMSPMPSARQTVASVAAAIEVPTVQVDAHNIVPVWHASVKREVGARTLRPKLNALKEEFLVAFPTTPLEMPAACRCDTGASAAAVDWTAELERVSRTVDCSVAPLAKPVAGVRAAHAALEEFCTQERLGLYGTHRNDPLADATSRLSAYFHFGQLSAQRAVLAVEQRGAASARCREGVKGFVEEAFVRRELADNYCFFTNGAVASGPLTVLSADTTAEWARETLTRHTADAREYVYTEAQFTQAKTHDPLWNAAQRQLVTTGHMHGFLRMYWAKKILEWTATPQSALEIATLLNDRYSLDGRDPNGYVGILWAICGTHDMGWKERPIFGKIRFMNFNGCRRKFDVDSFCRRFS